MTTNRINARLPDQLANHVARVVGVSGYFETPSEYIRDLVRRDMESSERYEVKAALEEGYADIKEKRFFKSDGNFADDLKQFESLHDK